MSLIRNHVHFFVVFLLLVLQIFPLRIYNAYFGGTPVRMFVCTPISTVNQLVGHKISRMTKAYTGVNFSKDGTRRN